MRRKTPPPPRIETIEKISTSKPVATALLKVCGLADETMVPTWDELPELDKKHLPKALEFLANWAAKAGLENDEAVATAVFERAVYWKLPDPLRLSQIAQEWVRLGRALELRNQPTNEVNNGKNISNTAGATSSSPRRYENAAERKSRKWEEWGNELGVSD